AWATEFADERLGTAMEPIVDGERVYVTTHAGSVYALKAESGELVWRFQADGPFLHSPAAAGGWVIAASADGYLYGLRADSGRLDWQKLVGAGGCSASPLIAQERAMIGSRQGDFVALSLSNRVQLWRASVGAPIRQTAAFAEGKVFITAED